MPGEVTSVNTPTNNPIAMTSDVDTMTATATAVAPPPPPPLSPAMAEGYKRSALSARLLKAHLPEFQKLQRSSSLTHHDDEAEYESTSATTASSTASSQENEELEGVETTRLAPLVDGAAAAAAVRSKFLHKLGINATADLPPSNGRDLPVRRPDPEAYEMPLQPLTPDKKRPSLVNFFGVLSRSNSAASLEESKHTENDAHDNNPQRHVHFNVSVTVHPIPLHTAYSRRIRQTVWTSAAEMEENVARNCLEFAAEQWDWRQVLEDEDMRLYHGELVHPVHFGE